MKTENANIRAPKLPPHCGSWILVQREPRRAVLELFSQRNADKLARQVAADPAQRYELLPACEWLGEVAQNVKRQGGARAALAAAEGNSKPE